MVNMTEVKVIDPKLSSEELAQLAKAKEMPITFDDDSPETTPERALKFKRVRQPQKASGE